MTSRHMTHCNWWAVGVVFHALVVVSSSFAAEEKKVEPKLKEFDARNLQSPKSGPRLEEVAKKIIDLTNEFRKAEGRGQLSVNKKLTQAAQYIAAYMAQTGQFSHEADGNRPADRVKLFGYEYCNVAENIAWQGASTRFAADELARTIVEGWKKSRYHRENMLEPDLTEIGVAIAYDPKSKRFYAAQEFGRPESAAISFDVVNQTPDTIHYTVSEPGRGTAAPQKFDLPPRVRIRHPQCTAVKLDWGWTEKDDGVKAVDRRAYVVTKTDGGYKITEQAASE